MEVILVHPDAPEAKVTATSPLQVTAFRGQGFVEESELAVAQEEKVAETSEVEKLQAKLAEAEKRAEEAEKRAEAATKEVKAKADAEATKKEKEAK